MAEEAGPGPNPGRCIYGFASLVLCYIFFGLFIVWAYTPSSWLELVGLSYFSSKYYALAIPVYCCVITFLFVAILYPALILTMTEPSGSQSTLTDSHSRPVVEQFGSKRFDDGKQTFFSAGIPPIGDLDIRDVNQMLYFKQH
ncbi:Phosphatidylinositol N-acetylglucosaminyltransferase subunit P [Halotydeus destructor]|nr:Phosphatidylinositol N-acetylglucosaminyltransferase subunit P [Halotydeus destructor]